MMEIFWGLLALMVIVEFLGKTIGRNGMSGQTAVTTNASMSLSSTGPPAESEYPVDPTCEATITPSAWHSPT